MTKTSIKALIQELANKGMPSIVIGTVTNTDPVQLTLMNDMKIRLSAASLIIPSEKRPLKQGENFYLLSLNNNKIYYLLDRM